jgi:hypothetical protein
MKENISFRIFPRIICSMKVKRAKFLLNVHQQFAFVKPMSIASNNRTFLKLGVKQTFKQSNFKTSLFRVARLSLISRTLFLLVVRHRNCNVLLGDLVPPPPPSQECHVLLERPRSFAL